MWFKGAALFIIIVAITLIIGCSDGGVDPISPEQNRQQCPSQDASHQLRGLWQFEVDPVQEIIDIVPLRGAELHLNALPFLEPPAGSDLTVEFLDFSGNQLSADIGLRHPFLGLTQFTGFDVCGVFITSGNVTGFGDPDLRMTGEGDTRLLNPDGFTRWWNPAEFPVNTGTIQSYKDGLLGTAHSVADFNCTLNGYKYYADELGPADGLDTLDPSGRGVFAAGQKNIRRYIIKMESGLVFNYAIDACWKFPSGPQPWDVPGDFSMNANRPEAWNMVVTETNNTLWNDGVSSGGSLSLSMDVYDHLNADLNTIRIESPGNFIATIASGPVGGGDGYSTWEVDIFDASPAENSIELLIAVESEMTGYGGLLPGKIVSAYFTHGADIAPEMPAEGIYVDGDNPDDPLEDGSMSHPFDTIQEGISAAGVAPYEDTYDVYVDPYEGGNYATFQMMDDVRLHGDPWECGAGKPGVIFTDEWVMGDFVDNCLVEGFVFNLYHTSEMSGMLHMMIVQGCTDFTIEDCIFTGEMAAQYSNALYMEHCDGFELRHNEFVNIRNRSLHDPGTHRYFIVYIFNSDGGLIIHNEMHDIGYDDEGPATTSNYTAGYLMFFQEEDGDHCEDLQVVNNLFYDINDFSKTSGTAKNFSHIFGWSDDVGYISMPNFTWANNTADDISVNGDDAAAAGCASLSWGRRVDDTWTVKNSVVSNMAPVSTVEGSYHRGFWAETSLASLPIDYSCCFNFGTPDPGVTVDGYYDVFIKGTNSFDLSDNQDPAYDMTPGPNWYHVTNPVVLSDDGSEMGAFGGPEGDWLPPSQE